MQEGQQGCRVRVVRDGETSRGDQSFKVPRDQEGVEIHFRSDQDKTGRPYFSIPCPDGGELRIPTTGYVYRPGTNPQAKGITLRMVAEEVTPADAVASGASASADSSAEGAIFAALVANAKAQPSEATFKALESYLASRPGVGSKRAKDIRAGLVGSL